MSAGARFWAGDHAATTASRPACFGPHNTEHFVQLLKIVAVAMILRWCNFGLPATDETDCPPAQFIGLLHQGAAVRQECRTARGASDRTAIAVE